MNMKIFDYEEILSKASAFIQEKYVFPEMADQIADHLQKLSKESSLGNIGPEELVEKVNFILDTISYDKHLRLQYTPESFDKDSNTSLQMDFEKYALEHNFGFSSVEIKPGNIGYINARLFSDPSVAGDTASSVMNFVSNTYALIFDLRQHKGGSPEMVALLISYLLKGDPVHINSFIYKDETKNSQSWTLPYVPGKRYIDKLVYVLISERTASAGEEFAYDLQQLQRATIIGETSRGAANPGSAIEIHPNFNIFIPVAYAKNPISKDNWEGKGVKPDIEIDANSAYQKAYHLASTHVLENHIGNGMSSRFLKEEIEKEL